MMSEAIKIVASVSVSGILLALILLLAKPVYKNRLRKSWQYYVWLVVLFRMLLPFTPEISLMSSLAEKAEQSVSADRHLFQSQTGDALPNGELPDRVPPAKSATAVSVPNTISYLGVAWMVTALAFFAFKVIRYWRYVRFIKAERKVITDEAVIAIYHQISQEMKVTGPVPLYLNSYVRTPVLAGIIKPCIIMPETGFTDADCRMIFRHELTHYKRYDILYKWFAELILCVHWFNPLMYLIRKEIHKNSELSCDEAVLSLLGEEDRRTYGDALMASLQKTADKGMAAVYTAMGEDGRNIKERLESVMEFSKKSLCSRILSYLLILALIGCAFFLGAYSRTLQASELHNEEASETLAAEIDLAKAGDLKAGNGKIKVSKSALRSGAKFSVGNGEIYVEDCEFVKINISAAMGGGEIKLADGIEKYDILTSILNGKLIYSGERIEEFRNRNAASKIEISNVSGTFAITD